MNKNDADEILWKRGIEEFNRREFFQCHETLEELWKDFHGIERELIQGIIQIAVGYYHHIRGNQIGAVKLLKRGLKRIDQYIPVCMGIDLENLTTVVAQNIDVLESATCDDFKLEIARIRSVPG